MTNYEKYRKKKRCKYPFAPVPVGYCYGYANGVDDEKSDKEIEELICDGCEFYVKAKELNK